jgi:tartrate-resistant acid phosphatase type 5
MFKHSNKMKHYARYFLAILSVLSLPLCGHTQTKQEKFLKEEVKSGYTGGFIDSLQKLDSSVNFIAMGDWGRNGEYHQTAIADQMAKAVSTVDANFILALGDNFYPDGVKSVFDPLWKSSYEDVYHQFALERDWYVAIGNHDYKTNPYAEVQYSSISHRWHMPALYYSKKFLINGDTANQILLVVIDTNPFEKNYYQDSSYAANVTAQDTAAQMRWLNQVLSDPSPNIKWRIVAAHHPMYTGGKRKSNPETTDIRDAFQPVFDKYHVNAFICGHEHDLQIIQPTDHFTPQFISGSASEVRPTGSLPTSLFSDSEAGFMVFSINDNKMLVQVIDETGKIVYTTQFSRQ